jgi:hypothetical protein
LEERAKSGIDAVGIILAILVYWVVKEQKVIHRRGICK